VSDIVGFAVAAIAVLVFLSANTFYHHILLSCELFGVFPLPSA
jgi:hypothetical protein